MEDQVRVDAKIDQEHWKELTEFIDENKESRKHSKQFYLEKIVNLALERKRTRQKHEQEIYQNYKKLRQSIKEDLDV
ncbi:hypothetical protein GLU60_02875 [Nanohaloarchaea archaeon H01]|jgi:uncharacterized HAD superfamily protein|nr:hypothetical protein [Nanohaloarchaea archaeon H01]